MKIELTDSQARQLYYELNGLKNSGNHPGATELISDIFPNGDPTPKHYRLLSIGEQSRTTDEFFHSQENKWKPSLVQTVHQFCMPIRREIVVTVKKEYQELREDETLQKEDQYKWNSEWHETCEDGHAAGADIYRRLEKKTVWEDKEP